MLSGFVIRFVTETRERDARRYLVSRASRVYSVVLPAMLLTTVLDAISRWSNPVFYRAAILPEPWSSLPFRIGVHLVFLSQAWGHASLLLSNTPFWSLGYEVPYYVLFGITAFARGGRRVALLAAVALVCGPQVLFLLPIWWSGIWLYDAWQWWRQPARALSVRVAAVAGAAALLAWTLVPFHGRSGYFRIEALPNPLLLLHQPAVRATLSEYAAAAISLPALFLLLCASDLVHLPRRTFAARAVRQVAEGTFTLYLFHYPMLVFARALRLYRPDRTGDKLLLLGAITLLCVGAAVPIAGLKRWLRDRMPPGRDPRQNPRQDLRQDPRQDPRPDPRPDPRHNAYS